MSFLFLDPGNSNWKARNTEGKELKTLALIAQAQDAFTEKKIWQIDGHYIGKDAIIHGHTKDYSLDEAKTSQSTFQILTKYMLCNYPNENRIVFLFPYKSYFTEKKKILDVFSRPQSINYKIGNIGYVHHFNPTLVKSLPQGYATGMDYYLDDDGKPKRDIPNVSLIIDIGMGTVNYLYMLRGQLIQDMSYTTPNGMHQTYKRNPFGKNIYEIDYYYGYGALDSLVKDQATLIKTDVSTYYNTNLIDEIVVVGGGALSTFDYLPYKQKVLHPELEGWEEDENGISAAQFAGVRGADKVVKNLKWGECERTETMIS